MELICPVNLFCTTGKLSFSWGLHMFHRINNTAYQDNISCNQGPYKLGWAEPHSRFPVSFPLFPCMNSKLTFYTPLGHLCTWRHLPLEVVFIWRICKIWFGHRLILKFEYDPIGGCWDIPFLISWTRLSLKVGFF